ncbi:MAG: PDZ domain-containing protein [Pyrinomonadaceae bacterium]|nr:PDZ domain-containing protein [Pyrinomonadaceae bacterium]
MRLRNLILSAFALVLVLSGATLAQQTPAPPAAPDAPDAPMEFNMFFGGGSFLGVHTEEITRENMGRFNLREPRGVAISKVVEGSPAEKAGLRKDDVVLRFNGEEVTSVRKLTRLIGEVAPDHAARLTISRSGSEQELSVTLGQRKDYHTRSFGVPLDDEGRKRLEELYGATPGAPGAFRFALSGGRRIGVSTTMLTKQLADYFNVPGGQGVLLTNVKEGSPAAKAGLKAGDVITEVDGERIEDAGDLSRAINRKTEGDITLSITRDKSQRTIRVTPEKAEGSPLFAPEMKIETAPRMGQLSVPMIRALPKINKSTMQLIQAAPRIRALIGTQPL